MSTIAQIQTPSTLMQATASPCQEVTPPARVFDRQARMARIIARQTLLDRVETERGDKYTLELRATQDRLARLRIADQNAFNVLERRVDGMQAQMPLRALQKQLDAIREEERTWITRLEADVNTLLQRNFKPLAQRIEAYTQQTTKQIQEVQEIVEKERQSIAQLTKMVDTMQVNIDELQRRHQELQTSQGDVSVQISHLQREAIALQQAILQAEIAIEDRKENRWMQVVKIAAIIGACSLGSWVLASAFKAGAIGAVTGVSAGEGVGFSLTLSGGELTAGFFLGGTAPVVAVLATSGADSSNRRSKAKPKENDTGASMPLRASNEQVAVPLQKPIEPLTTKIGKAQQTQRDSLAVFAEVRENRLIPATSKQDKIQQALNVWELNSKMDAMLEMRVIAAVGDGFAYLGDKAVSLIGRAAHWTCQSHPTLQQSCDVMAHGYARIKEEIVESVPLVVRTQTAIWMANRERNIESEAISNERRLGIPQEMTKQYHRDLIGNLALFLPFGFVKSVKATRRIDYSATYQRDIKEFLLPPKEFSGSFSKDVVVVQYHSAEALGSKRSLKWVMPVMQGNQLGTIEKVKDCVALLSKYGERSHVTVMRIPAGDPVRFLYGRTKKQVDPLTLELRPGGGVQYRFYDVDPRWIRETRKIPT